LQKKYKIKTFKESNIMKMAVIGAGKWGQALYHAYSQNNDVVIHSRSARDIENFVSLDEALNREYLVLAIPAQFVREWMKNNFEDRGQNILVAAKGIETSTGAFLNEIYGEFLPKERLAFISGPSFAAEVQKSLPTALMISSTNTKLAQVYADHLPSYIKGYVDDDVVGAEVSGAYKNVIAIAGGVCDGLGLGNNARAALISRGLVEMTRFGEAFGAKSETFLSLGGAGDLFLTASSTLSRNYRVGLGLAKGKSMEKILQELGEVAEGVPTAKALHKIVIEKNIYLPIAQEVYAMIEEGKDPMQSVKDLLS
jgi:glycerol-3-phosphate dehydrogenase (NAD(P)+)